ncbi:hypothetical protein ABVK25_006880 [Lepraria finkii]|uniref:Uncharacterized protein n=1 Tax=Lepraria finkii TaxID=1340010 RepID=A0ABR4B7V6_9LECA
MIAFLVDLEVWPGIINACLPVMKPDFNRLGEANLFASLSRRTSIWTASKRSYILRSNHNRIPSLEKNDSGDRRKHVVREGSYQMISQVSLPKGQNGGSASPTAPQQVLSKNHVQGEQWGYNSLGTRRIDKILVITRWDIEHQPSRARYPVIHPSNTTKELQGNGGPEDELDRFGVFLGDLWPCKYSPRCTAFELEYGICG